MLRTVAGALRAARFVILALVAVSALAGVASAHTGKAHHKRVRLAVAHNASRKNDNTAPTAPGNLTARPGDQTATLNWTASTDNRGVKGYKIYRNGVFSATAAGWSTAYTDGPVPDGQAITYTVRAYDQAGNLSDPSNAVTVTPTASSPSPPPSAPDTTPPSAPSNLTATASDKSAGLSWSGSTDDVGVTGYRVFRGGTQVGSVNGSTTTYSDTGLTDGTSYSYTVKAVDAAGNVSPQSNTATATPQAPVGTALQPNGPAGTWNLSFDDEFDGTSLDRTKWAPCWFYPTCGTMNNASTPTSNVSVGGGDATLTLASSNSGALISTNPKGGASPGFQFQYGVVEARIWFPGDGTHCYNWPAWWTDGQSWPTNGENDIAEVLSGPMTVNYHSSSGPHGMGSVPGYWCSGYHTYTLNRQNGHADVYYDGKLVKSYSTDDAGAMQYLIVNVGSSSSYPAYGAASQVKVDYVRAWQ